MFCSTMLCCFSTFSADAQNRCGSTAFSEQLMQLDPEYLEEFLQGEKDKNNIVGNWTTYKSLACPSGEVVVPVAVHFESAVPASDQPCLIALAQQQIDIMNADFDGNNASGCSTGGGGTSDACITFVLANQNHPAGTGLVNGDNAVTFGAHSCPGAGNPCNISTWNGYLNILIETGTGNLGVAPLNGNPNGQNTVIIEDFAFGGIGPAGFPGGCNSAGPQTSPGTNYNGGATCTHEVGHFFGLPHPFCDEFETSGGASPNGDDSCLPSTTDCDGIADTPLQEYSNFGCVGTPGPGTCPGPVTNPCGEQLPSTILWTIWMMLV